MKTENKKQPQRSRPAQGVVFIPNRPTIIFDTVCTKNQKKWLADPTVHAQLREVWQQATEWILGRYMIMPDHIHFIAAATGSDVDYDSWVKYWKSMFSKRHKNSQHRWLPGHWDRRLRSEEKYEEKWNYVRFNPVRQGLVENPEDWPFQGEIHEIMWC